MVPPNGSRTTTDAISSFLEAIRSSKILSERQLEKLEAKMATGEHPTEPADLASRLVKEGILTEYQAGKILKGKPEGLIFGGYVILDFLGKGSMGKVYKAWHRMMGRVVALKVLEPRYITSTRSLARFQREMQLVGRLDHPNVVRAFDADRVGDCHFIAMEYAAGPTLEKLLNERGALSPTDVVYLASQAAEGLAHAHSHGIVHRDIKPSNLVLTEGRKLKVLDFGLGTLLEQEDTPSGLTTAGSAVGTPDYISPEQARMVKIDGRSDLYSLGCTMYHLLSGQLPFKGESSMDCIIGRITGQPIPITEVRPDLPPRLVQTIEKLLATNPDDRYQTADEAAVALRSLLRPKKVAPDPSAPAVAAVAAVPEPVVKAPKTRKAPAPPVQAEVVLPRGKPESPRSVRTTRGMKTSAVIAAIAVGAVLLIVATMMLFRSPKNQRAEGVGVERTASQQETLSPNASPSLPVGAADVPQSSRVTDHSKQGTPAGVKAGLGGTIPQQAGDAVRRSSLVIENPQQGATVGTREQLTGRIEIEGWPVIFVQPDIPGELWWCQAPVESIDGGRFSTAVVFGDEFTPSRTRFRIAGIVTRTREEALKFAMGSKQRALPEGLPRSIEMVVTHR